MKGLTKEVGPTGCLTDLLQMFIGRGLYCDSKDLLLTRTSIVAFHADGDTDRLPTSWLVDTFRWFIENSRIYLLTDNSIALCERLWRLNPPSYESTRTNQPTNTGSVSPQLNEQITDVVTVVSHQHTH